MAYLIWLIPLFPLLGFLINGLGYKKVPKKLVGIIGSGSVLASFIVGLLIFKDFLSNDTGPTNVSLFNWIHVKSLSIDFSFLVDRLSILMVLIVTGVGFLIHLYSIGYMHKDEGYARYFSYLNLFTFSMLLLVLGSNYVIMFIGWEGVGLCSYLLIGFWFKNHNYNLAANKAFIMNRVGDLGFLLGLFLIYITFGSLNYNEVFEQASDFVGTYNHTAIVAITLLLFIGATGKSAQIPLYTWLPDAMAGPTPVSALIHAATMVTAGIYMIVRSNILYTLAPYTLSIIAAIGLITSLIAAVIALTQRDIKKVLAYSTVSQLGYMFLALGVTGYTAAIFHLMTHAFFKALLFLAAGSVIHAMSGEQNIQNMGGLKKYLPITYWTFLIATLAISGIPPFSGFFSKDEILVHAFSHNIILWLFASIGALLTAFYMFRLLYLTFHGDFRGSDNQKSHLHESPRSMTIPLIILAILSATAGFVGVPASLGVNNIFSNFLEPIVASSEVIKQSSHSLSHYTEYLLMIISTVIALSAIIITYWIYIKKSVLPVEDVKEASPFYKFSYHKFYIDELYNILIVSPLQWISKFIYRFVEVLGIDSIVNNIGKGTIFFGQAARLLQAGSIGFYIFAMVIGVIIILFLNFKVL